MKAKGIPMDSRTVVGDVDPGPFMNIREARRTFAKTAIDTNPACSHPSGFLYVRRHSPNGSLTADLFACPHCQARRLLATNGATLMHCEAGGEWQDG